MEAEQVLCMRVADMEAFLRQEKENGASTDCLRQRKTHVYGLYEWLPEGKEVTAKILRSWQKDLQDGGYSKATVSNYVKGVNRYLRFMGRQDLLFSRGKAKDLTGQEFGYLTALEPTGKKDRNDYVWRCRCRCGKETELPATRLLTGNTLSCGCLTVKHLQRVNQYIDHTSLHSALREDACSPRAASGYTGVVAKRGKWQAYINYKGKRYALGTYSKIEDAVKARAYAKDMIQEDAKKLLAVYETIHKDDPAAPERKKRTKESAP